MRLSIAPPYAARVTSEAIGEGMVVRLPLPLEVGTLDGLAARHPGWIADLRFGFDSFFVRPKPGVALQSRVEDGRFVLLLSRTPVPAEPESVVIAPADDGSALRLERLDALARGRDGDRTGASRRLRALMEAHPKDVQNVVDLIEQERELGRWRDALALHDRALALDANAAFLIAGKASLLQEYGSRVRAGFQHSNVSGGDEQFIWVLEGRHYTGDSIAVGVRTEYRHVSDDEVRHPAGAIERFESSRLFASAYLEAAVFDAGEATVTLHATGSADPGVTLGYRQGWNAGETRAQLDLWRPYWDFVEGIAHGGYRHRATVQHRLRLEQPWYVEGGVHTSRYGIDGARDLADALGAQLFVAHTLIAGDPRFALEYYFDTEYFGDVETRPLRAGETFAPVDFTDREIHQLHLVWREQLTDYIRVGARGGYTFDRINSGGHSIGVDIAYTPVPGFEFGARFNQSITSARGDANELNSVGGYVLLRL